MCIRDRAMTANATNTDVANLGYTFKYVAPVAGALGYSIEAVSYTHLQ